MPTPSQGFGPKLAHFDVSPFECRAYGIAKWQEVRALQQDDLRLQQPAAFKFDATKRHGKGIVGVDLHRQQGRRTDAGMHRMCERRETGRRRQGSIRNPLDRRLEATSVPRTLP